MVTVILTFLLLLILLVGMAIGVIMGREPLTGSCGGMSALNMDCDLCKGNPDTCATEQQKAINSTEK